jgi:hypothetical protein
MQVIARGGGPMVKSLTWKLHVRLSCVLRGGFDLRGKQNGLEVLINRQKKCFFASYQR